ncbi:Hepatocellular carcinoma-associated antigen 59 family-containing protein [Strongyloides ratti]|uniref:Hepatocellular carcinoma-associated antigen 59 family-containing protein n=1 Tax=Strongyloides ratti TaxID=34506 RepID=A0A090LB63_STRRB|nr:Hepatocellular carcinoma-associated antigen 59 family-containing protein [Strongyloides ratti]CEF65363.1 Hepatocellular carcinoma-associated antigen 59 family-containing protein [Strongyloides ratti]
MSEEVFVTFRKTKRKINTRERSIDGEKDDLNVETLEEILKKQKSREIKRGLKEVDNSLKEDSSKRCKVTRSKDISSAMISDEKKSQIAAIQIKDSFLSKFRPEGEEEIITEKMNKDNELRKRRAQLNLEDEPEISQKFTTTTFEDEILYKAAEKINEIAGKSNIKETGIEMDIGIPEVDVGFENKVKRIVELEEKKKKLSFLKQ